MIKRKKVEEVVEIEKVKRYKAINTHIILWVLLFVSLGVLSVYTFLGKENKLAIVFLVFAIIGISPVIFSPTHYIFTQKSITIVYLFGVKERVEWWEIRKITETGEGFGAHYNIKYSKKKKHPFFATGEIIKNRRTRKLLERFYIKDIKKV